MNKEEIFKTKLKSKFGDYYNYDKVIYNGWNKQKIVLTCPIHGDFELRMEHIFDNGIPCPKCRKENRLIETRKNFIEKARKIHGDKYDYSKVQYCGNHTKVCIICPIHGEFWQTPANHTHKANPCGCSKCAGNAQNTSFTFIEKAKEIHGDKYNYSKTNYINCKTKVCIICPEHGEFWQTPSSHLSGRGCPLCRYVTIREKTSSNAKEFIEKARKIHGDKYDYSKVEYVNTKTKVCIICPEHGEFWQTPDGHVNKGHGCIRCIKNYGEESIENYLKHNNIKYFRHYHSKWLERLELDFYLPEYNIAIEYQGEQHYHPVKHFGGLKRFKDRIERDERKKKICIDNNVQLIYVSYFKYADNNAIKTINELEAILKTKINNI